MPVSQLQGSCGRRAGTLRLAKSMLAEVGIRRKAKSRLVASNVYERVRREKE